MNNRHELDSATCRNAASESRKTRKLLLVRDFVCGCMLITVNIGGYVTGFMVKKNPFRMHL